MSDGDVLVGSGAGIEWVRPTWGPFPTVDEVRAHPSYTDDCGAMWFYRTARREFTVAALCIGPRGIVVRFPGVVGQPWREATWWDPFDRERSGEWRPVDADGMPVKRGGEGR